MVEACDCEGLWQVISAMMLLCVSLALMCCAAVVEPKPFVIPTAVAVAVAV